MLIDTESTKNNLLSAVARTWLGHLSFPLWLLWFVYPHTSWMLMADSLLVYTSEERRKTAHCFERVLHEEAPRGGGGGLFPVTKGIAPRGHLMRCIWSGVVAWIWEDGEIFFDWLSQRREDSGSAWESVSHQYLSSRRDSDHASFHVTVDWGRSGDKALQVSVNITEVTGGRDVLAVLTLEGEHPPMLNLG